MNIHSPSQEICSAYGHELVANDTPLSTNSRLQVEPVSGSQWDVFVSGFKDAIHEQTCCFNEFRKRSLDLQNLVVRIDGRAIGGALVKTIRLPVLGTKIAIIRWGPIWRPLGKRDDITNLRLVYEALSDFLETQQKSFLLVIPRADAEYGDVEKQVLDDLGFKPGFKPPSPSRYFVNVQLDEDAILASMNQKWRYNLRKSWKSDLDIQFVEDGAGLGQFLELYNSMVERKQFLETSPIETLRYLMGIEHEALRPKIVIASKDGEPVAGGVIDCSGERAIYLYGATNHRALGLKAGYAMQWHIIQYLAAQKHIRWYDLGGGTASDCSLHQFKRGLVGKDGVIAPVMDYHTKSTSAVRSLIGQSVLRLELARSSLQKAMHDRLKSAA